MTDEIKDPVLALIQVVAKGALTNDQEIIGVLKTLTERHIALELKVQELREQVATIIALHTQPNIEILH